MTSKSLQEFISMAPELEQTLFDVFICVEVLNGLIEKNGCEKTIQLDI